MATELTWLGHGTWTIRTGGHQVLLDPFLDDNPSSPVKADDVEADFILVSHGHFDHVADAWADRVNAETDAEPIVLEPGEKIVLNG